MAAFAVVFQLTSSRGGWPFLCFFYNSACNISTHILTRRMTKTFHIIAYDRYISTHILTRRMTDGNFTLFKIKIISTHILTRRMTNMLVALFTTLSFQLTSSRGGWPKQYPLVLCTHYFNSHPHEEDDGTTLSTTEKTDISTHILTRRMTYFVENPFTG